ncbi:exported hypothetical protein [[Clostridium] ultunense Esp]|nr:exported hypothetical protein [[Clostridium] ultunense Esp]
MKKFLAILFLLFALMVFGQTAFAEFDSGLPILSVDATK